MTTQVRLLLTAAVLALAAGWLGLRGANVDLRSRAELAATSGEQAP